MKFKHTKHTPNIAHYGAMALALSACGEPNDTQQDLPQYPDQHQCITDVEYRQQFPFRENYEIALAINIVLHPEQQIAPVDEDSIKADIEYMRSVYAGLVQDFYVTSVDYHNATTIFDGYVEGGEKTASDYIENYVLEHEKPGAIDIFYLPQYLYISGRYVPFAEPWPVRNEEGVVTVYVGEEGKSLDGKTLAHEVGHALTLEHPFQIQGDGIDDTNDYGELCAHVQSITANLEGNVCIVSCGDGSNSAPANLMDYNGCSKDGQSSVTLQTITQGQKEVINCRLSTDLGHYDNTDLTRIEF